MTRPSPIERFEHMTNLQEFGYRQELKRALTLRDLIVFGMIFMVPISPFGVFGFVKKPIALDL